MRKSNILPIILGILTTILILGQGIAYASCGGSWYSTSCSSSPYANTTGTNPLIAGLNATEHALNGQLTNLGISQYAQKIVAYALGFISIIAVIYIIYAGFQLMIGAGDEEKMKKTRQIILYVIIGILIIWLSFPIVKWTIGLISYEGSLIQQTLAYTESDNDTFADYKDKIKEAVTQMESELLLNKTVNINTVQNVKSLIQGGFDRLPDNREVSSINREAKQIVDTYLDLAIKNPTNTNHIGNAISRVNNFLEKASIFRITGSISAGPSEGHAPLSVSFRASEINDPSGTTPGDNNYVWWTRENGGYRRELSRGPSLSYTFIKEGTYTIFLDVISGSRNSKGKIDVLPLSVSKQIIVKPKLGEIVLLINGVNVSNMTTLKISPAIGNMGVILDASASRAIGNGTIAESKWDFGNGESSNNSGGPIVERQIYANQGSYILKLSMKTNDGQIFKKELQLLVRDPSATIKLDRETGHIGEDISMSATSYLADMKNIEYTWQIQNSDTNNTKIIKAGEGANFKYKFDAVGSYIVSLTAKSPNGNIDTDSKIITIESREPVVSIDNPKPINNTKPNTILFDASKSYDPDSNSRKNLSYIWKIDGRNITLDNIEDDGAKGTYTFDTKGSHKISVTVTNIYGKIKTIENQFEVSSILAVNMFINPRAVVRGTPVSIIGQSSNAEFFEWNMGDGSAIINGTSRSVRHIYKQSGVYPITLNINRDGGTEINSITRKVYVSDSDSPFAIIDATNTSSSIIEEKGACNGMDALVINRSDLTTFNSNNSINIDGTTNGLTYTWKYFGKARTTQSIAEKFNELGCFPIELTVRSNKNGASHTTTQYIKLENRPPELTSVTTTIDSNKKDSQKILVKVQANGALDPDGVITSYIWYYKTESDPEAQNVQITQKNEITFILPNITEKYYFGVILEDNDGAKVNSLESGQGQSPLVIDNSNGNIYLPLITLTVPKTVVNIGEKVWFSAGVKTIIPGVNITNKVEYAWDFDGDGRIDEKSTSPSIEHTYARSGDYNMKIRVTNNGVSNSKYQIIHVKNKLKADVYGYKLPNGRIYFMNASEGSYDKAYWEVGTNTSESLTSMMLDTISNNLSGKLTISSNENDTSTTNIDLSKVENISGTGLLYQSFPRGIDDIITIKNPGDRILLSMLGNDATNYAIDTNIMIDTNLDGIPDNDQDNKDDISYADGSIYALHDLGNDGKREHKIRLALIKNGVITTTRTITIVFEYITNTIEKNTDLSGSGVTSLSTGDRNKLEELSKMIRELNDSDRIILMQRYNTLIENWNNPFDKAKSLIDIQEGVDSGNIDVDKKIKISKVIDELLIGDAQVTDEVGIAAILIRDLIPKESPNYSILIEKLAEIESHPTLLNENKKLGKEMLILIETDGSIPDKYKGHIKNQLLIIINGGSSSIPTNTGSGTIVDSSSSGGVIGFISGFIKVFFIIIGIILFIGILAFVFYRFTRKGDNIGFQDFLIDSVFHSNNKTPPPISNNIEKSNSNIVNGAPPLPPEDPLINYVPATIPKIPDTPINIKSDGPVPVNAQSDPLLSTQNIIPEKKLTNQSEAENVPDWLKLPISSDNTTPLVPEISTDISSVDKDIIQTESTAEETNIAPLIENTPISSENIPDWLNTPNPATNSDEPTNKNSENDIPQVKSTIIEDQQNGRITENIKSENDIPEWIKNTSIADIESPIERSTTQSSITNTTGEEKLPDWLVNSLQPDIVPLIETQEIPIIVKQETENSNGSKGNSQTQKPIKKTIKKERVITDKKEKKVEGTEATNLPSWLK